MLRNNEKNETSEQSNRSSTTASGQAWSFFFGGVTGLHIYNSYNSPKSDVQGPAAPAPKK